MFISFTCEKCGAALKGAVGNAPVGLDIVIEPCECQKRDFFLDASAVYNFLETSNELIFDFYKVDGTRREIRGEFKGFNKDKSIAFIYDKDDEEMKSFRVNKLISLQSHGLFYKVR